jgi:hypothetical protein
MIAVAGLVLPIIDSEWTGDRQHAGHHQGALDPGGDAPKGLQVHAARVPKAPTDRRQPGLEGVRADRLHGGCGVLGFRSSEVRCLPALGPHDRGRAPGR